MLRRGGIEEGGGFGLAGIEIANYMLHHGRISYDDFYRICGSQRQGDRLLSKNIFTRIPRTNWVFFDTMPMELAVREFIASGDSGSSITVVGASGRGVGTVGASGASVGEVGASGGGSLEAVRGSGSGGVGAVVFPV